MRFHVPVLPVLPVVRAAASAAVLAVTPVGARAQAPTPAGETRTLQGVIGHRYRIQMTLRREGARLFGDYFYETVRKPLRLDGSVDARGSFLLREFDARGIATGVFRGRWEPARSETPMRGDWSRPDGTRPMPFRLLDSPIAFRGALKVVTRDLKEQSRRGRQPAYEITAEYPQLEGSTLPAVAGFNRLVRGLVDTLIGGMRREFTAPDGVGGEQHVNYYLEVANDDVVSVHFTDYFFYTGAGRRNAVSRTLNYDLRRGRRIALEELFTPGSGVERVIADHALRELKRVYAGEPWATEERLALAVEHVVGDEDKWLVGPRGLVLVFDSEEFGPPGSAAGTVVIPYVALKRFVRRGGPLAPLIDG